MRLYPLTAITALIFLSCGDKKSGDSESPRDSLALSYTVLKTLPHDTEAFTEGLTIYNNRVFESTGQHGTSWIAEVDPGTGVHTKKDNIGQPLFRGGNDDFER